jgi:hypothetical protein
MMKLHNTFDFIGQTNPDPKQRISMIVKSTQHITKNGVRIQNCDFHKDSKRKNKEKTNKPTRCRLIQTGAVTARLGLLSHSQDASSQFLD